MKTHGKIARDAIESMSESGSSSTRFSEEEIGFQVKLEEDSRKVLDIYFKNQHRRSVDREIFNRILHVMELPLAW